MDAAAVRAALGPVAQGARAVVAVSGGADSAALALLTQRARPDLTLHAVHVRHGLRDDRADLAAASALAERLGLPLHVEPVTVTETGEGPEAAARAARYDALARAAARLGATAVLTGHTADDQAETVLLALTRGTGLRGLAAMPPTRPLEDRSDRPGGSRATSGSGPFPAHPPQAGPAPVPDAAVVLVRPLLRLRRSEVRAAAEEAGLPWVEDPTNRDLALRRNLVRAQVLPAFGRDVVPVLARLADLARDDADLLDAVAEERAAVLVRSWGPVRCARHDDLVALPPALRRRVVRLLLAAVRGGAAGLDLAAVERVLALRPTGETQVPGGATVTANGGWLAAAPPGLPALPTRPLALPGSTPLPELGLALSTGAAQEGGPLPPGATGPAWAAVPAVPLVVRARRDGDPLPGRPDRRLGERLTDLGVPRALRGLVPVVATPDPGSAPVWVPGIAAPPDQEGRTVVLRLHTLL